MHRTANKIVFILICLVLPLAAFTRQAQEQPAPPTPQAEPSAKPAPPPEEDDLPALLALLRQAGGPEKYPEANALVILDKEHIVVRENGEFTSRQHSLVKILTDKGRLTFATRKIPYHRRYNTIHILRARVIKKNGAVIDVPPEAIKDGTMEETQQMNILEENFRRWSVAYPSVENGDSLEIQVETISKPLIKDHFNYVAVFQDFEPRLAQELTIVAPSSRPLKHVVRNGRLDFSRTERGGQITYTWKTADVPQLKQEAGMVSPADVALKLVVGTFSNWAELSRYGHSLNQGKVDSNDLMKAKVRELTKDCRTEEEKILAIHRYISQKVRYMGSSMDLGAFIEPHQATYTFEKQYGVCRDKSILMMAMLREIGVESFDTLINISQRTETEVPTIFFEHAICGVVLKDGRMVFMDPTLELSSSFGETYVGDRYVLLLDEKGKDLLRLPHVPAERSLAFVRSETAVLPDGGLEGKVRLSGRGFSDFGLRSIGKQVPAYQFPMVFQHLGSLLAPTVKVSDVKASDFSDLAAPYHISFNYKARDYVVDVGPYKMFRVPLASYAFDVISIGIFEALTDKAERLYPLFLFSTRGSVQEEVITLPPEYEVIGIPDPVRLKDGPVSLSLSAGLKEGKVVFTGDFRIEQSSLDPAGYQSLRRMVKALRRFQKSMVILQKRAEPKKGGCQ
jgi:hypothetical protein